MLQVNTKVYYLSFALGGMPQVMLEHGIDSELALLNG
jgi:hypothetical protein